MTFSGAILIVFIAFLRHLLRYAVPKRTFFLLWTVALLRLLVPFAPVFSVPVPLPEALSAPVEQTEQATSPQPSPDFSHVSPDESSEVDPPALLSTDAALADLRPAPERPASAEVSPTPMSVWQIVWLTGSIVCGAAFVCLYAVNYRRFRRAVPVESAAAATWLDAHPLRRPLAVRTLRGIDSPLTYGVLRPVILVPQGFDFENSAARYALEHEYVHAKRFDAAFKLALAAALTAHWCNPAVWLMYVLTNRDIELSCDEAVLRRFGAAERGAYARALLAMEAKRSGLPALYAGFGANTTKERILAIMKFKKTSVLSLALAVALVLALAACAAVGPKSNGVAISGESLNIDDLALRPEGDAARIYVNDGMSLLIPLEYDELVTVDTENADLAGLLFTVSEKASVEAAEAEEHGDWGMGWLFSIGRVSKAELDEMMSADMSNAAVFARDGDGNYYMFYHASDVRFYRVGEVYQDDQDGWQQWEMLSEWAYQDVRNSFIAENPGLTAYTVTNTGVDIYLARLACWDDIEYTLGSVAFGPLSPDGVDAAPYVERLRSGVTFETVDSSQTPSGEFFVLNFPDSGGGERFDFFAAGGNYVREVYGPNGEYEILYKAAYADGTTESSEIVADWYFALAAANGLPAEEPAWIVSLP